MDEEPAVVDAGAYLPRFRTGTGMPRRAGVAVTDEIDQRLPRGEVGEIVTRPKIAHTMMLEYFEIPATPAAAPRNRCFHAVLPRTQTERVEPYEARASGVTPDTGDARAADR